MVYEQKTFDGKKPYKFLQGVIALCAASESHLLPESLSDCEKRRENADIITIVRSEIIRAVSH